MGVSIWVHNAQLPSRPEEMFLLCPFKHEKLVLVQNENKEDGHSFLDVAAAAAVRCQLLLYVASCCQLLLLLLLHCCMTKAVISS